MLIKPQEAKDSDAVILDIRTKAEHDNMHLTGDHKFIPLDEIVLADFVKEQNKPLLILCHSGGRARTLCELLVQSGLPDTKVIEGGISACKTCMPVLGNDTLEDREIHNYAQQSFQLFLHRNRDSF